MTISHLPVCQSKTANLLNIMLTRNIHACRNTLPCDQATRFFEHKVFEDCCHSNISFFPLYISLKKIVKVMNISFNDKIFNLQNVYALLVCYYG